MVLVELQPIRSPSAPPVCFRVMYTHVNDSSRTKPAALLAIMEEWCQENECGKWRCDLGFSGFCFASETQALQFYLYWHQREVRRWC